MEGAEKRDGKLSFSEINDYLAKGSYPEGLFKSEKSVMGRCTMFCRIHEKDLYYIGTYLCKINMGTRVTVIIYIKLIWVLP